MFPPVRKRNPMQARLVVFASLALVMIAPLSAQRAGSLASRQALTTQQAPTNPAAAPATASPAATPAPVSPAADAAPNPVIPVTLIRAGRLLDVRKGVYIQNAGILVEGERIKEVGVLAEIQPHVPAIARIVDLSKYTVLPGLIDCHTHLMARFADADDAYLLTLAKESEGYRALEGAANARLTLMAGFTTVRDVESEGSGYADVALRDAIRQGLVQGPRMQVATRGIAAVGQYNPFHVNPDLRDFPTGAAMISGVEEARRAVREQIGNGADLIKVYADWNHPTLTFDELLVVVEEAHKAGLKVAAHATTSDGIRNAVNAGADSVEHGHGADQKAMELIRKNNVFLVPTVGVIDEWADHYTLRGSPNDRKWLDDFLQSIQHELQMARSLNIRVAAGSDASRAKEQGKNALELAGLVRRGFMPIDAIRAATVNAAELMSWQDRVGSLEPGKYADIIAVEGDPLTDVTTLQRVRVVIKGGETVKDETHP
ncbi:amidohydrolase family protein [Acidobacteria bacterium AB60]|nr:amidohydrolase family protein [Acidobacteria bacterium AB60]